MRAPVLAMLLFASCGEHDRCPAGAAPVQLADGDQGCRRPNGDLDGPVLSLRHHGVRVGEWHDNKKVGEWVYRFPDGNVSAIVDYRDGLEDGISTFRTRDDRVLLTAHWTAGLANGAVIDSIVGESRRHFLYGRRSGMWQLEATRETRVYAFDGTLIVWNGRPVSPPPPRIRLSDERWIERTSCNLATWQLGFASPCLDLFEAFQHCETESCRELALDGYLTAPPPTPFWKDML